MLRHAWGCASGRCARLHNKGTSAERSPPGDLIARQHMLQMIGRNKCHLPSFRCQLPGCPALPMLHDTAAASSKCALGTGQRSECSTSCSFLTAAPIAMQCNALAIAHPASCVFITSIVIDDVPLQRLRAALQGRNWAGERGRGGGGGGEGGSIFQ